MPKTAEERARTRGRRTLAFARVLQAIEIEAKTASEIAHELDMPRPDVSSILTRLHRGGRLKLAGLKPGPTLAYRYAISPRGCDELEEARDVAKSLLSWTPHGQRRPSRRTRGG